MRTLLTPLSLALMLSSPAWGQAPRVHLPSLGQGDVNLPLVSLRQAKMAGTLRQQYDFSCGSAALATLLTHHYDHPVTESEVFMQMYEVGDQAQIQREGFSLLDMKRFLQSRGFVADGFELPLDKLLEARTPAIVLINENGYMHFVVVKGLRGDRVLIGDPANGTRSLAREAFEAHWPNRLLFVIHSHMHSARFNQHSDWAAVPRAPLTAGVNR
jgi:uncharacterized protein